jgi:hypothetical protein
VQAQSPVTRSATAMSECRNGVRFLCRLLATVLATALSVGGAFAACGESDGVRCLADYDSVGAVVWAGNGFTAAARRKSSTSSGVVVVRFTPAGESRVATPIQWPSQLTPDKDWMAEPRKLISLPGGAVVLLVQVHVPEGASARQLAWATRIEPNGQITWTRVFSEGTNSIILHSGLHDQKTDRLVLVGRRTLGGDDGKCENWSQSLVVTLKAADGITQGGQISVYGEEKKGATNRQAIYDITPGDRPDSFIVAGFVTAPYRAQPDRCQDNVFVGRLSEVSGRWALATLGRMGSDTANDVALAIKGAGDGSFLVAGFGRDTATNAPAAQAYRVQLTPFVVQGFLSTPHPPDGSDKSGGDRFRVIAPLAEKGSFLLAGSASASIESPNHGLWQTVSANLKSAKPTIFSNPLGSEILDAALTPDGKLFAVGRLTETPNNRVGWAGFIFRETFMVAGTTNEPFMLDRRRANPRLARVTALSASAEGFRVPPQALSNGAQYFDESLPAGTERNLLFSISSPTVLKISTQADAGDIDLVLLDSRRRPIEFSNFRKSATELIVASLAPGEYTLSIIANTAIRAYEVRFAPFSDPRARLLEHVARLNEGQRIQVAGVLSAAGFTDAADPRIALGGESLRALMAAQEGATRSVGLGEVGRILVQAMSAR